MVQLLFGIIFSEMALILLLLFKTPLRKLVIMALDRAKRGRGPVVVRTVAATVFAVLMSAVHSVVKIRNRRLDDGGGSSPTDQVLMANHLLQACLMGCSLFLGLMIDRLHHHIRELRLRRKNMDVVKKQTQGFENGKDDSAVEIKALEEAKNGLKARLMQLQSELETKSKAICAAETNAIALRKQSEGFLLEYDRLLKENQILRNELKSLDRTLSHSGSKKNT